MAIQLGQPINLGQTGLVSAARRRLSAPSGAATDEDEFTTPGLNVDPFQGMAQQTAGPAAAPPPQVTQAPQLRQFAFNPKYAGISAGLDRNVADAGLARNNGLFQAEDLYKTQLGEAETMQKTALQKLRDMLGARGLFNSSIMQNETAKQNENYAKYIDNLGKIKGNKLADIEGGYARSLEDVNRQREGLYFQQVQEEEELARQRAAQEAENARRQAEIEANRRWQEQQAAEAAAAREAQRRASEELAASIARQAPQHSVGVGVPGPGDYGGGGQGAPYDKIFALKDGTPVNKESMMWQIAHDPDFAWLNKLWDKDLHLPADMRQAVLSRIASSRGWGGGSLAAL